VHHDKVKIIWRVYVMNNFERPPVLHCHANQSHYSSITGGRRIRVIERSRENVELTAIPFAY